MTLAEHQEECAFVVVCCAIGLAIILWYIHHKLTWCAECPYRLCTPHSAPRDRRERNDREVSNTVDDNKYHYTEEDLIE